MLHAKIILLVVEIITIAVLALRIVGISLDAKQGVLAFDNASTGTALIVALLLISLNRNISVDAIVGFLLLGEHRGGVFVPNLFESL